MTTTRHMVVCPYCGTGCKFNLIVEDDLIVGAEPLNGYTNEGFLCLKGWYGYDFVNDTKILTPRLYHPLMRKEKGGPLKRVSWDTALNFVAEKLTDIIDKYGPDSVYVTGSSRGTGNESNLVMSRFARACIGTNNIDNCGRV